MQTEMKTAVETFLNNCAIEAEKLFETVAPKTFKPELDADEKAILGKLSAIIQLKKFDHVYLSLRRGLHKTWGLNGIVDKIEPNGKLTTIIKLWTGCEDYPETDEDLNA